MDVESLAYFWWHIEVEMLTKPYGRIIGVLENANESLLKVNFGDGFEVKSFTWDELKSFFSANGIENYYLPEEKKYVFIITKDVYDSKIMESFREFAFFNDELNDKIRLLRLFKEGDVYMPTIIDCINNSAVPSGGENLGSGLIYDLKENEIPWLQNFLDAVHLPFKKEYIKLAFENFELSYNIPKKINHLQFLVIMTGLEILLSPADAELTYRISRNTAVLTGQDKNEATKIFNRMKKLYKIRSQIVHSGSIVPEKEQILELRNYLRTALKKVISIDKEKDEVTNWLDSHGFGDGINFK